MEQQVNLGKTVDNQSRALSAIGYLGWLVLVPILAIQNPNNFVKRHINCSLTLLIMSLILGAFTVPVSVVFILGIVKMSAGITVLGTIIMIIYSILLVGLGIIQWVCLIRAALGYEASLWKLKIHNFLTIV